MPTIRLAYNLGNFLRRLCLPKAVRHWSLRSVQVKLIKMGGRLVRHSRRLNGLAGPDYDATISFGLPFELGDCPYGKSRLRCLLMLTSLSLLFGMTSAVPLVTEDSQPFLLFHIVAEGLPDQLALRNDSWSSSKSIFRKAHLKRWRPDCSTKASNNFFSPLLPGK